MFFNGTAISLHSNPEDNFVQIDYEDFRLSSLSSSRDGNKGASSSLFRLVDPYGEVEDRVIKICKTPTGRNEKGDKKRIARFKREIQAFRRAARIPLANVVSFFHSGELDIQLGEFAKQTARFHYIVMEKADEDLASYLENNKFNFTFNQKLGLCVSILSGIKQLHDARIYHRDIKHDNILRLGNEFKIGDLGLVDFQDRDYDLDYINEKIGPVGWLSPEATNKMLTEGKEMSYSYDCIIDTASDIFQLGKLFWYIFQGNLPTGQILRTDSHCEHDELFQIIFEMLRYRKEDRPTTEQIQMRLRPIMITYGV